MQAIKKILNVNNNTLILKDLDALNNKTVEVIIIPVKDEEVKSDKKRTIHSIKIFYRYLKLQRSMQAGMGSAVTAILISMHTRYGLPVLRRLHRISSPGNKAN